MKLDVVMFYQDDPKKCTAAKMIKFGLAKSITTIPNRSIVLDPFSEYPLLYRDRFLAHTLVGIDCSWNLAQNAFTRKFKGIKRKLPPLMAGNPVNYAKFNKLTTAEAMSAALFILGYDKESFELLNKFKWGHTFYELNQNLLLEYKKIKSLSDIDTILKEYGFLG